MATFEERLEQEKHVPTAAACLYVHEVMKTAWAAAQSIFGDKATPEIAIAIFDRIDASNNNGDYGVEDAEECDNCGESVEAHPVKHEMDGDCPMFVEPGMGCDRCGNHDDAHLGNALDHQYENAESAG